VVPATSADGSITEMLSAPPEPASAIAIAFMSENACTDTVPVTSTTVRDGPPGAAPAGAPTKASTVPWTVALASAPFTAPRNEMATFWVVAEAV
jgi:hypothetical protein